MVSLIKKRSLCQPTLWRPCAPCHQPVSPLNLSVLHYHRLHTQSHRPPLALLLLSLASASIAAAGAAAERIGPEPPSTTGRISLSKNIREETNFCDCMWQQEPGGIPDPHSYSPKRQFFFPQTASIRPWNQPLRLLFCLHIPGDVYRLLCVCFDLWAAYI